MNIKRSIIDFSNLIRLWKEQNEHKRLIKFCIIGLSGILVNEGLLWALTEFGHLHYLFSSIIAIEISILSNFILNDIWTFRKERKGHILKRLAKFNLARILTLAINFAFLWILTSLNINYLIGNLIGIAIATVAAYFLSTSWVWN